MNEKIRLTPEEILRMTRALCEREGYDFLCIVGEKSTWSCPRDSHIGKVAEFHHETENGGLENERPDSDVD